MKRPSHRLSNSALEMASKRADVPRYDRSTVTPGIVHLGLGAFHRAHQAVYVDQCLNGGQTGWGIVGVSLRSAEVRDALQPQDGLYAVAIGDGAGEHLRVVGSITRTLVAPEQPGAVIAALSEPTIRLITLTVTEKAYLRNAAGDLDRENSDIAWDLANPGAPRTIYGILAAALVQRRSANIGAFTVLCCDNLPANGATLKRLMLQFAAMRDDRLAGDVGNEVAFPSCMVDRIVPATTDADRARISGALGLEDAWPVKTEPFSQWVIEEDFPGGRPDWERFGVTMVADVRPYEMMKLRLLNGAHSAIAFLGLLSGHETVADAFGDPAIRGFIEKLWAEAIRTLPQDAGLEPQRYTQDLSQRFANTALRHRNAQIACDSSQKLPQRIVGPALDLLERGNKLRHLPFVVAAWAACCQARGRKFPKDRFTDPLDGKLTEMMANGGPASETIEQIFDATGFAELSPHRSDLVRAVGRDLDIIQANGIAAALETVKES